MSRKGFTLIELIITLLVLGILSAVVITGFIASYSATKLEAARWKLKSDILYAQGLAVSQQVPCGVIFLPAQETYSVYRQDTGTLVRHPLLPGNFTVNYAADPDLEGVDLVSTAFGSPTTDRLEFDEMGVPSDGAANLTAAGTVALRYGGSSSIVTVTPNTGKVQ